MQQALIIDTSLGGLMLATAQLSADTYTIGDSYICTERRATDRHLAAQTKALLAKTPPLTKVIVSIGPGSFTGIRVGIAFASGLAVTPQRLLGISSLYAIAARAASALQAPVQAYISITADSGAVAEFDGDKITMNTVQLPLTKLGKSGGVVVICGKWPRLDKQLKEKSYKAVINYEEEDLLDYASRGMAQLAQHFLDEQAHEWPQPLYLKEPYVGGKR